MKTLSNAAQVAKIIRTELKKNGVKASVKCQNYAGGSSVDVYLNDELPATVEKIKTFCSSYKYGNFDSMTDCYEMSNVNKDLPQVSCVFVNNKISDTLRQKAWDFIRGWYAGCEELPTNINDAMNIYIDQHHIYADMLVNRVLSDNERFLRSIKPRI